MYTSKYTQPSEELFDKLSPIPLKRNLRSEGLEPTSSGVFGPLAVSSNGVKADIHIVLSHLAR